MYVCTYHSKASVASHFTCSLFCLNRCPSISKNGAHGSTLVFGHTRVNSHMYRHSHQEYPQQGASPPPKTTVYTYLLAKAAAGKIPQLIAKRLKTPLCWIFPNFPISISRVNRSLETCIQFSRGSQHITFLYPHFFHEFLTLPTISFRLSHDRVGKSRFP